MATGKTLAIVICLIVQCSKEKAQADETECSPPSRDFETSCKDRWKGALIGSRCYFLPLGNVNPGLKYPDAEAACTNAGAVLAQIHTEAELQGLAAFVAPNFTFVANADLRVIALAIVDSATSVAGRQPVITSTSYWNAAADTLQIPTMNTWARSHASDITGGYNAAPRALGILTLGGNPYSFSLGDWELKAAKFVPLCQTTNIAQKFNRASSCIAEVPASIHTASAVCECAQSCAARSWCHSFNWMTHMTQHQCQLFTWALNDPLCKATGCAKTSAIANCVAYDATG